MWLNEKNIKETLDHKNLTNVAKKYPSKYRKHREKQTNRIFLTEVFGIKVII